MAPPDCSIEMLPGRGAEGLVAAARDLRVVAAADRLDDDFVADESGSNIGARTSCTR